MSGEPTLGDILATVRKGPPILRAARGDVDALRELTEATCEGALNCIGLRRIAELSQALAFARLLSVHGEPSDAHESVATFGQLASECRALGDMAAGDSYEAQGYLLAETLAEDGDEVMAELVVARAVDVSPGAHIEAKRLREFVA